jgi:acyl-coenzyme A synthetase/AMP-(fatty) acid ligase
MEIIDLFKSTRNFIEEGNFSELKSLKATKPENFNWYSDIFEPLNIHNNPNDNALIWMYNQEEKSYTFKELGDQTNQFLNFIRKHGIQKADKLYAQLPLVPINWIAYLACIKGGIIISPTATTMETRDIEFRFQSIFPEMVLADEKSAEKIDAAESKFDNKIKLKLLVEGEREGWINVDEIFKESKEAETALTKSDDPLFYFFTSGTTGMPKVVVHTHFTYPVGHLTTASWIGLKKGDLHYNISQPGWAKFFWSSFFAPWNMGACILGYHADRFNAKEQLTNMERLGVTTFCAPPTALRTLIQENLSDYNFKLRECVSAGEPLNPEIIQVWKKATGVTIRDGYGQTESTVMICNLPGDTVKFGSMGKPSFLYDIVIADDDGTELAPTEEGNICVRQQENAGNGIFKTYLLDKERLKQVFKNNLYYTGDKAYKDEEGYYWFVGRDDDVIKASDYRIGPFEVESVLMEHPSVKEVAVVASPHEIRSNAVKAYVILVDGVEASEELAKEIFDFSEEHLARYKLPRIIEFVTDLPKTISGKIRRIELRAKEVENRRDRMLIDLEFFHEKY